MLTAASGSAGPPMRLDSAESLRSTAGVSALVPPQQRGSPETKSPGAVFRYIASGGEGGPESH